jgi:membrane-bound lytic murein transglycosylase B
MTGPFPRVLCALLAMVCCHAVSAQTYDVLRADIQQFAAEMSEQHGFDRKALLEVLGNAVPQKRVLESMQRPAERTLTWAEYRARFMTEERITAGLLLWNNHSEALNRVATEKGVPAQYLVAITGVETFFGRSMGKYRVLDSLATLAFDHPTRGPYFRRELEQYLLMAREEGLDPRVPLGSYAGAMGAPQFMPTSQRSYAVDGNGDGHRNLWDQWPDVFASIANYFVVHGWQPGQPVLAEAQISKMTDDPKAAHIALQDSLASLRARGYRIDSTLPDATPTMLVPTDLETGLGWRVGFQNFYVITRYNRSWLYAMAVHDLAMELVQRHTAAISAPPLPGAPPSVPAAAATP